ncbi:MAG: phytoene desaturase family protein [Mycobacteriaceae bacterium]
MKTLAKHGNKIVIVGAGLSGLSAGLHLLGSGREVTILEKNSEVGGKVGTYRLNGFTIDSGATVLTMPELIAEALAAVGQDFTTTTPALRLKKLDPAYLARFSDGSAINVRAHAEDMAQEIENVCGKTEAEGYWKLRKWLRQVFEIEFERFINSNFDSPLDLVSSPSALLDLTRLAYLGGFGRLGPRVNRFICDSRLQRIFTFQSLYAGLAPSKALAVYGAIAHMDTSLGVFSPEGGMRNIALAMANAFTKAGGVLHTSSEVTALNFSQGRVTSAYCADRRVFQTDALVLTADTPIVNTLLCPSVPYSRRTQYSPSAVVLHGKVPRSVSQTWSAQGHHTIDFGWHWERTFKEITGQRGTGTLMSDPSLLITRPAMSDPELLIDSIWDPLSVLAPCPNLDSAHLPWEVLAQPYAEELTSVLSERGYTGIKENFTIERIDTPASWLQQGMPAGTPFSAAHIFRQTGPFRRKNLVTGLDNVVLAGSGTTPGVGIPTVIISGKLAAQRIIGSL